MSIKASTLRKSQIQNRQINDYVKELLKSIDEEIMIAHREGQKKIKTNIPIVFDIQNMSNIDAQRSIFARVILNLIDRGFRVKINPSKNECRIFITWLTVEDELRDKHEKDVLSKHIDKSI